MINLIFIYTYTHIYIYVCLIFYTQLLNTVLNSFNKNVHSVMFCIFDSLDHFSYFSFQPMLHNWCNKGRGMCYPVCGMVHIKAPLLLIDE